MIAVFLTVEANGISLCVLGEAHQDQDKTLLCIQTSLNGRGKGVITSLPRPGESKTDLIDESRALFLNFSYLRLVDTLYGQVIITIL